MDEDKDYGSEFGQEEGPEIAVENLYSPSLRDISRPQSKKGGRDPNTKMICSQPIGYPERRGSL